MRSTRTLSLTTAFVAVVGLLAAACGQDSDEPVTEDDPGGESTEGASGQFEDVTLEVYSWRPEDADGYRAIFDAFEEQHPGITVNFSPFNSTDYDQILRSALQADTGPDLAQLRPYRRGVQLTDQGYFEAISDLEGIDTFDPEFLEAVRGSDGEIYGVPLALNAAVTFYNVDVFEQHDVDVPTTWPELLDAAEQLLSEGVIPIAQAGDAAYLLGQTHSALAPAAYGPDFIDQLRAGEADLTAPEFRESVERMAQLEPYFPPNFVGITDDEARGMFVTSEAAMYINGDYRIAPLRDLNPDVNMGILPSLPDEPGGQATLSTWVDGAYGAVASSENVDAARELLRYMTTPEFGRAFAENFTRTSPVPGVEVDDVLGQTVLTLNEASSAPSIMHTDFAGGEINTKQEFDNALQGMYVGEVNLDDIIEVTQQSAEGWYEPFQQ